VKIGVPGKGDYDIEWIEKHRSPDQLLGNQESAAEVLRSWQKTENAKALTMA